MRRTTLWWPSNCMKMRAGEWKENISLFSKHHMKKPDWIKKKNIHTKSNLNLLLHANTSCMASITDLCYCNLLMAKMQLALAWNWMVLALFPEYQWQRNQDAVMKRRECEDPPLMSAGVEVDSAVFLLFMPCLLQWCMLLVQQKGECAEIVRYNRLTCFPQTPKTA